MTAPQILVGADQTPQPPAELVRRLSALEPLLFVKYHAAAWRVFRKWDAADPRWARVQAGEVNPECAHDLLFALPAWLGVDEMAPYLERELRSHDKPAVQRLADEMNTWNASGKAADEAVEQSVGEVVETTVKEIEQAAHTPGRRKRHTITPT